MRKAFRRRGGHRRCAAALVLIMSVLAVTGCQFLPAPSGPTPAPVIVEDYLISAADLPEGWRISDDVGRSFAFGVCGVELEPSRPDGVASTRFAVSQYGPFLEQNVRTFPEDGARSVIDQLAAALPGCRSYRVPASAEFAESVFTVEPIAEFSGPDRVGWRQHPEDQSSNAIVSEYVVLRRGGTMIIFVSYDIAGKPDRIALRQAIAALPE